MGRPRLSDTPDIANAQSDMLYDVTAVR